MRATSACGGPLDRARTRGSEAGTGPAPSERDGRFGVYEDHANSEDGSCTFINQGIGGWQCEGEHWMCYCIHYADSADCGCEKDTC